jgi:hypothetical protein
MKLPVPYASQHAEIKDKDWQSRACGIACVKMVIDYFASAPQRHIFATPASMEDLLAEGVFILEDGLAKNIHGWVHDYLVALLHNHGVPAYKEEFRTVHFDAATKSFAPSHYASSFLDAGVQNIVDHLDHDNPVIVSGIKDWKQEGKYHLFVVVGYEKAEEGNEQGVAAGALTGFYYHDPDAHTPKHSPRENLFISLEDFKSKWRKMAIFPY